MSVIAPGKSNIVVRRGTDYSEEFEIEIDGTLLNLTGAIVTSQIRETANLSGVLIKDFTVVVSIGAVSGYLSTITLSLTDTQTLAIDHPRGFYDVLITDSVGNDAYYIEGSVEFRNSVTVKV